MFVFIVRPFGLQISNLVHIQNALEKFRVRLMADGYKNPLRRKDALLARHIVKEADSLDTGVLTSQNFLDLGVPQNVDLLDAQKLGPALSLTRETHHGDG